MGIARRLSSIQLARPGLGEPATEQDEAYKRWYVRFLIFFGVIAILAIILALTDNSVPFRNRVGASALTVGLMAWFWWRGQWHQLASDGLLVVYMTGMLIGVILAIRLWDGSGLLLFSAYWLGFAYFRTSPALVYAALLTIGSQWAFGAFNGVEWGNISFSANVILIGILALVVSGMMAGYIEMFSRESDRRAALLEELKAAQEGLAKQERAAGVQQERERMAAEIHDTIAQHFTSIVTNLTAAESRVERNPAAAHQHVNAALISARQGITDARRMVRALQPEILSGRTISQALQHIASSGPDTPVVQFTGTGTPGVPNRLHEAILVRALEEALGNVRKHAEATRVDVTLAWEEDDMILDIADNGRGFDPASIAPTDDGFRMGLRTMRNRVEGAGGTWMLETAPGEGTSLAISFPISRDYGGEA